MPYVSLEKYTELQTRAADRILTLLDRIDIRNGTTYQIRRTHARLAFRGQVRIIIYVESKEKPSLQVSLRVWARSLSQGGFSFIHPGPIKPRTLLVQLPVLGSESSWFRAEIMRAQEIPQEEFWEFGVRFCGRILDPAEFLINTTGTSEALNARHRTLEEDRDAIRFARVVQKSRVSLSKPSGGKRS